MPKHHNSSILVELLLPSSLPLSKMKNKASTFLKKVVSIVVTIAKAKSMAVKSKTAALKTRFVIFRLLHNKKLLPSTISQKIHALMSLQKVRDCSLGIQDHCKAISLNNAAREEKLANADHHHQEDYESVYYVEDEDYPDHLTHSLFDLDDDEDEDDDGIVDNAGSVIDLVRNSREDGSQFNLEDEIDHVADMFIKRFHRQMRLQKQESFKRHQENMDVIV